MENIYVDLDRGIDEDLAEYAAEVCGLAVLEGKCVADGVKRAFRNGYFTLREQVKAARRSCLADSRRYGKRTGRYWVYERLGTYQASIGYPE